MSRAKLESLARAFEGGGVQALERAFQELALTPAWMETLVEGCGVEGLSVPSSWLLRAALERGVPLGAAQTASLLRSVARVEADDARLHLCQLVGHLSVPKRNAEQLARFLRAGAEGEHKLVRAWAVDGFQRLASQHPAYVQEARRLLDRAGRDPAASVRARARRLVKELGY